MSQVTESLGESPGAPPLRPAPPLARAEQPRTFAGARAGWGPPTFSILASETSIKMLNFLTAARPFSSAMIHLSMFFPRGQDTQSIILGRTMTVTQGPGRPKCLGGGSPGTNHNVLRLHNDSPYTGQSWGAWDK